jgi:hypothetical protein
MPAVLDQSQPFPASTSGRDRDTPSLFLRYFNEDRAVTTPTSSRDLAKDFPRFPLVRYLQGGISTISATPPPLKVSSHRVAETNLRRPLDPGRYPGASHCFRIILGVTFGNWPNRW